MHLLPDQDFDLVLAGGANQRVFSGSPELTDPRYRSAGYVTDSELRALYEHAVCLVYPSLYEGFGLPPLEAMACGCPVITSRAASLPEVCGEAALYCDPRDPADIAQAMRRVLGSEELRRDLRQRGLERSSQFRWSGSGEAVLSVLEEVRQS
jgi:glycosyltransferase involved in cell wall biosynthesis